MRTIRVISPSYVDEGDSHAPVPINQLPHGNAVCFLSIRLPRLFPDEMKEKLLKTQLLPDIFCQA